MTPSAPFPPRGSADPRRGAPPPPPFPIELRAEQELRRARKTLWTHVGLGFFTGVYFSISAASLGMGAPFVGLAAWITFIASGYFASRKQARSSAAGILNVALNHIALGRTAEALELLAQLEAKSSFHWVLRIVEIQRALIAVRRGDLAEAQQFLDRALARPVEAYAADNAMVQIEGARALRAFVRASLGDETGAGKDIAWVRAAPAAPDEALARVALAEAILLQRANDRDGLRAHIEKERTLLFEHTHPRDRAIVRAFQRMLRSDKGSVYRRPERIAQEEAPAAEPTLATWIAKIAPEAAAFVRTSRPADASAQLPETLLTVQPSNPFAANAVRAARGERPPRKPSAVLPALFVGLMMFVAFAVIVAFSAAVGNPALGRAVQAPSLWGSIAAALFGMSAVSVGVAQVIRRVRRKRAETARTRAPRRHVPTDAELSAIARGPDPLQAAHAFRMLADRAERRGDLAAALALCEQGLRSLGDPEVRARADILLPDLVSLRAFLLACAGRYDESAAELANLPSDYPNHATAVYRTKLVFFARTGPLSRAAEWAEGFEADLPLTAREELLTDLVRAAVWPERVGSGEVDRIREELQRNPASRAWIERVAPAAIAAFDGSGAEEAPIQALRVAAMPGADDQAAQAAIEEASATEEALHGERAAKRG